MLAFVHIEKTAGTTFIHVLRDAYFLQYLDVRPFRYSSGSLFQSKDLQIAKAILPTVECIGGHSVSPQCDFVRDDDEIKLITILRNPVDRYVSQYQHWIEKKRLRLSFEEFLEIDEVRNLQTKKISGSDDLEAAKSLLETRFLLVGLVEQFHLFIDMLNMAIPYRQFRYPSRSRNRGRQSIDIDELKRTHSLAIEENNRKDIALYEFVRKELISEYKKKYPDCSEATKSERQILNSASGRLLVDYGVRKLYVEPITGIVRLLNDKPYKGSY